MTKLMTHKNLATAMGRPDAEHIRVEALPNAIIVIQFDSEDEVVLEDKTLAAQLVEWVGLTAKDHVVHIVINSSSDEPVEAVVLRLVPVKELATVNWPQPAERGGST